MAALLCAILGEIFDVVAVVGDGVTLLARVSATAPDVVVCDIGLPRLSGLDAAEQLLCRHAAARVVLVTVSVDPSCVARALTVGVRGYVAKADAGEELVTAVLAALGRRTYLSASVRAVWSPRTPQA